MRNWLLFLSGSAYRLLLRAYPAEFRHEYGAVMLADFRARCRDQQGFGALVGFWIHTVADWVRTAPHEHFDVLRGDVRYGARLLLKNPGFTAVAVLSLALGIGANTAIFSAVNAVLLRPLPYREPDRLVDISGVNPRSRWFAVSPATFLDWKAQNHVFSDMAAVSNRSLILTGAGEAQRVRVQHVSASFFQMLGVEAEFGRTFLPEEDRPGETLAVLSHGQWKRLGGDASLVGRSIRLDGEPHLVIGVMPATFRFFSEAFTPQEVHVWLPYAFGNDPITERSTSRLRVVARLKSGVSLEGAGAEMDTIDRRLNQLYFKDIPNIKAFGVNITPFREYLVHDDRASLLTLLAAVSLVLLIACVNVANLLLARATARQQEMTMRAALGARRGRLVRQLLTESLLLSALGGALGLLLAWWGAGLLKILNPGNIPRFDETGIDGRVFGFTLVASLVPAILFGLAPALRATRPLASAAPRLRVSSSGVLLVTQVALSLVLLIGSGLMIHSFWRLQQAQLGFDPENVLTVRLPAARNRIAQEVGKDAQGMKLWTLRESQLALFEELVRQVASLPGVVAAGGTNNLALSGGGWGVRFQIEGRPAPPPQERISAYHFGLTRDYFRAMGMTLRQGRYFTDQDIEGAPEVLIVNETFAKRYWPGENPIGRRLRLRDGVVDKERSLEVVGVVADVRQTNLRTEADLCMFVPLRQRARTYVDWQIGFRQGMQLAVRTASDPLALADSIRSLVRKLDPDQPVENIATMEQLVTRSGGPMRSALWLLGVFAGVALLLSAVGIHGVVSYVVSRRRQEIGVRMAMGAQPSDVVRMVIGHGMLLAVVGVVLGLAAAIGATRVLASLLYQVKPTDPVTFTSAALFFLAVALVSSYLPARRAAQLDPMAALRHQ